MVCNNVFKAKVSSCILSLSPSLIRCFFNNAIAADCTLVATHCTDTMGWVMDVQFQAYGKPVDK